MSQMPPLVEGVSAGLLLGADLSRLARSQISAVLVMGKENGDLICFKELFLYFE